MNAVKEYYEDFTFYLVRDRIIPNRGTLRFERSPVQSSTSSTSSRHWTWVAASVSWPNSCGGVSGMFAHWTSRKNIAFAKETVKDVDFVVSDFLSFPTQSSFDLITFFDVLEHFPREKLPDMVTKVSLLSHEETAVLVTIPSAAFARSNKVTKQVVDEEVDALLLANLFAEARFELRECRASKSTIKTRTASCGSPGARPIGHRQSSENPS